MEKPISDQNESLEDAFSDGSGGPISNPVPKGSGTALSVPGGPNPNVIPD